MDTKIEYDKRFIKISLKDNVLDVGLSDEFIFFIKFLVRLTRFSKAIRESTEIDHYALCKILDWVMNLD